MPRHKAGDGSRGFEFEMVNVDLVPDADVIRPGARVSRQLPVVMAGDLSWSGFRPDT